MREEEGSGLKVCHARPSSPFIGASGREWDPLCIPVAELWPPARHATGRHREHARHLGAADRRRRRGVCVLNEGQLCRVARSPPRIQCGADNET